MKKLSIMMAIFIGLFSLADFSYAQDVYDQKFQIGVRGGAFLGTGEPANDLPMYGIYGRYNWNDKWHVGLSLDHLTGDYEEPYKILAIESAQETDASMTNLIVTVWGEREFRATKGNAKKLRPFVAGGFGIGFVDVDNVRGDTRDGDRYDITTDPGTEFIPAIAIGLRYLLGRNWEVEVAGRYSYHISDWEVYDRESGRKDSLGNYSTYGIFIGIGLRF